MRIKEYNGRITEGRRTGVGLKTLRLEVIDWLDDLHDVY